MKLLYIDLFCGAGGTSTGVEFARFRDEKCCKVIACVNHDANAIASHAANHPEALHFTEDIRTLDLTRLIEYTAEMRKLYPDAFLVLWASLECTNFSKAKGGLPRDADSRTLAEHLYRYINALRPDFIQIENVEEFMSWGDLDENGKPISKDAGRLYRQWVDRVQNTYGKHADKMHPDGYDEWYNLMRENGSIGKTYEYDYRLLNSADYGAHTSRKRFFGIFARPGLPIVFPEPTHTKNPEKGLFGTLQKWNPVKDCLDFTDEGESIFDRKKDLVEASLERVLAGCIKFVAGGKDKWLMKYNSLNRETRKHVPPSVDDPCPTVSCQGRLGVVQAKYAAKNKSAFMIKYNSMKGANYNPPSLDEPCHTVPCRNTFYVAKLDFLTKHFSGHPESKSYSVEGPAHTITPRDHHSVVSARFIAQRNTGAPDSKVSSVEAPARTLTTTGGNLQMVSADFLSAYYGNGFNTPVTAPAPTVTTKDRFQLVRPRFLCSYNYRDGAKDINRPCPTLVTKDRLSLISPHFIMNNYSGGGQHADIENPCPAVTSVPKQNLVKCHFVDQQFGQSKPAGIDRPCGALTQNPKYNLVSCNQWVMNTGFNNVGSSLHAPAPVITANRKWHYLVNPQFNSQGGDINAPCFTLIARMDKRPPSLVEATTETDKMPSFIKIDGDTVIYEIYDTDSPKTKEIKEFMALYGLLDIKMRMLRIPELKMIMGFPKDYVLIGTQADQKKFIGNAVEVKTARAMAECLVKEIHRLDLRPRKLAA